MSRVCQITGKKAQSGHHVSHANNKTNRRFEANLRTRRFWLETERRWVRLRVSSQAMRMIDRDGLEAVVAKLYQAGV